MERKPFIQLQCVVMQSFSSDMHSEYITMFLPSKIVFDSYYRLSKNCEKTANCIEMEFQALQ